MRLILCLIIILLMVFTISSYAQTDNSDYDEIEELDEIVDISESGTTKLSWPEIIARLHSAVVHFPIAWIILLLLTEFIAFVFNQNQAHKIGFYLHLLTVLSFIPAILTGLLNAALFPVEIESETLINTHRNLNIIGATICLLALLMRVFISRTLAGKSRQLYLGLVIIASIVIMLAGHLGGKMVFGLNYLPF